MLLWIWELNFAFFNEVVHLVFVLMEKWWNTHDHFINQNAKSPPVNFNSMPSIQNNFRCKILRSSTNAFAPIYKLLVPDFFRKSEISHLDVPLTVKQDVLRLQVPINYIFAVKVL